MGEFPYVLEISLPYESIILENAGYSPVKLYLYLRHAWDPDTTNQMQPPYTLNLESQEQERHLVLQDYVLNTEVTALTMVVMVAIRSPFHCRDGSRTNSNI